MAAVSPGDGGGAGNASRRRAEAAVQGSARSVVVAEGGWSSRGRFVRDAKFIFRRDLRWRPTL